VSERILVIEDEERIAQFLERGLIFEGYRVDVAYDGPAGLSLARENPPDLVILDLMLPGMDGLEVCRRIKADPQTRQIPVVMLTAKGEEADIVAGLELGAEDYITKPFSGRVLAARVRRILRKKTEEPEPGAVVKVHELTIDPARHEVRVENEPVELTLTEFNILHTLARRPGLVFTRYQIVDAIHGDNYLVTDRAIDVQIVSLRKKLGPCAKYIETVRGVGYRFVD
jgi:two-component system alkaline phosphatase synthesis response regulator PhoP